MCDSPVSTATNAEKTCRTCSRLCPRGSAPIPRRRYHIIVIIVIIVIIIIIIVIIIVIIDIVVIIIIIIIIIIVIIQCKRGYESPRKMVRRVE